MMKINFSQFGQTLIDEDDKLGLIPSISNLSELNNWEHENIIDGRRWAMNKRVLNHHEILMLIFCFYFIKKCLVKFGNGLES